ncbi:UPF0065 protein in gbd 5'region [Nymphon striatum]|nr:UPF0065 protein in gbd 5'region [Nymphon striatum]
MIWFNSKEHIAALVTAVVATFALIASFYNTDPEVYLFPRIASVIIAILAAVLILKVIKSSIHQGAEFPQLIKWKTLLPGLAVGAIYLFLLEIVGFLCQPIYVTNKPGAGGRKGWNWFADKAPKDGYMMAAYNVPHFIAQSIVFKTKYNINNLEPVGNWGADPAVLIVGKDSKFNSVKDLVDFAKANPGKVTVSGAGKGGVGAMKLVKGGQVMAGFNNLSDAARAAGDIKILAVADLERHSFLPDVPTLKESGVDVDNSSVNFRGLMVPKGTPQNVIDHLAKTVPTMFQDKKTLGKMKQTNSPVKIMSRDEVLAMWAEKTNCLRNIARRS